MIITLFLLIFTISYGQHSNYKSLKTKLPIPLLGHITAIYNNDLFVFGGKNGNKFNDKFWKLPLSSFSFNMTNLDIINEPSNTDWMQISVKPPTYGSASNIGIGSNTFVCEHQCSVLVNQYLYIFGAVSFGSKQNNFINTIYRLDLSQDPPIFAFENYLPITSLNNAKPFCVTAAMGKIYINTPFKTIQYDPMGIELQTIAIQNASWYNVGCTHFKDKIYLFGGTNDLFDTRSYTVGINTTKFHDHTLNVYSRNNIKCISLGPYSSNIECPGGLNVVNHSYPQNSIIWNTYNNSQTFATLHTAVAKYALEYYQFYTGKNSNASIIFIIGGSNNATGIEKAVDTIQYAVGSITDTTKFNETSSFHGQIDRTKYHTLPSLQIQRRLLGTAKDCPDKKTITSGDVKTIWVSKFACKTENTGTKSYECKISAPTTHCPPYESYKSVSRIVNITPTKNADGTVTCKYEKHCNETKYPDCPEKETISFRDINPLWAMDRNKFKCTGGDLVYQCKLTYKYWSCPEYKGYGVAWSHPVEMEQKKTLCTYKKNCAETGSNVKYIGGDLVAEHKTVCEGRAACTIVCLPTYCKNEYIKAGEKVKKIEVLCENPYSCIGEIKINGEMRGAEGIFTGTSGIAKGYFLGRSHGIDPLSAHIKCSVNEHDKSCYHSLFGFNDLATAIFSGHSQHSTFIFKKIDKVEINLVDPNGISDSLFTMNSIFTEQVKQFHLKAVASESVLATSIDLRGLTKKQKTEIKNVAATLQCHGDKSCWGLTIIAKTCGGSIQIECFGKGSCDGMEIILEGTEQCGDKRHANAITSSTNSNIKDNGFNIVLKLSKKHAEKKLLSDIVTNYHVKCDKKMFPNIFILNPFHTPFAWKTIGRPAVIYSSQTVPQYKTVMKEHVMDCNTQNQNDVQHAPHPAVPKGKEFMPSIYQLVGLGTIDKNTARGLTMYMSSQSFFSSVGNILSSSLKNTQVLNEVLKSIPEGWLNEKIKNIGKDFKGFDPMSLVSSFLSISWEIIKLARKWRHENIFTIHPNTFARQEAYNMYQQSETTSKNDKNEYEYDMYNFDIDELYLLDQIQLEMDQVYYKWMKKARK